MKKAPKGKNASGRCVYSENFDRRSESLKLYIEIIPRPGAKCKREIEPAGKTKSPGAEESSFHFRVLPRSYAFGFWALRVTGFSAPQSCRRCRLISRRLRLDSFSNGMNFSIGQPFLSDVMNSV
jgi:hypothetical protein